MADPHSDTTPEPSVGASKRAPELGGSQSKQSEPASFRSSDGAEKGPSREAKAPGREAKEGAIAFTQEGGDTVAAGREAMLSAIRLWEQALEPIQAVQASMARWSDEFWRAWAGGARPPQLSRLLSPDLLLGLPSTDVKETADAFVMSVELPGLSDSDIRVSTDGDMLKLQGDKAEEQDAETPTYRRSERWFGQFERTYPLPSGVARDQITTSMRDGVLRIILPKVAAAQDSLPTGVRH